MSALVPRATVYEIEGHRTRALDLYAQAFDTLAQANAAHGSAAQTGSSGPILTDRQWAGRDAKYYPVSEREKFLEDTRKEIDRAIWRHLMAATNMERLMDHTAREEFRDRLAKDPPEATAENCFALMDELMGDAVTIFRRGIATAFATLDRRFRTHDGFKIGDKVIFSNAFSDWGGWNHWQRRDEHLRDVERAFYVLDKKPPPERSGGICGVIDLARPRGLERAAWEAEDEYFRVRAFKNGNAHVWFKRDDLVEKINLQLAEFYGATLGAGADVAETKPQPNRTPAKNMGWFPTPQAVGERVIEEARIGREMRVLEPSAGEGALALLARARGASVTLVEADWGRSQACSALGFSTVYHADFFDMTTRDFHSFDRVVMNPPFDGGRDIDHVTHALQFLKPGGRLVAVMSAGTEFRSDRRATDFRAKIEALGGSFQDLPAGAFKESGTMVNTVLCIVETRR